MLRFRLSLLVAVTVLLTLLAFGLLADQLFVRLQLQQLRGLLESELGRVQALAMNPQIGTSFLDELGSGFTLQFVSRDGRVMLRPEGTKPLALVSEPTLISLGDRTLLVSSLPWLFPGGSEAGTIRLALDASGIGRARRTLGLSLLLSGVLIASVAIAIVLTLLGRALAPLDALAVQADRLDPADPKMTAYRGPDDEVARVAEALNRALGGIRARQRSERDALAEVAHELAAPLSVVAGQLNALAGSSDDVRLLAARDAANELLYTSQDLLTLARGELTVPLELAAVDLAEVAARVAAAYPGVRVTGAPRAAMLGSAERMTQAVRNLVRNAVQAAGRPQGVALQLDADADEVRLAVVDDGPGLDAEAAARVFDRYYRRRSGAGAGVGLSVAQALALRHDGRIGVRSTPGEGSVFTLHLPTLEAALDDEDGPGAGSGRDERGEGDEGVGAPRTGPALSAPGSGRRR